MDNYIAEIRIFTCGFVPYGWLICDGRSYPQAKFRDLYSVILNQFGGDSANFNVPNLMGKVPVSTGTLNNVQYVQGVKGGSTGTVLTAANIPPHTHTIRASSKAVNAAEPGGNSLATTTGLSYDTGAAGQFATMDANMVISATPTPTSNIQPSLGLLFAIAYAGVYPGRS